MKKIRPIVYLVDDDASIRASIERLLKLEGIRVASFSSAEDFLKQAPHQRPGCLLLDVCMPGLSGLDLQDVCEKSGIRLPIVFITGHGKIPMTVQAMKKGAIDFLTKPFEASQLLEVVKHALEKDCTAMEKEGTISNAQQCLNELSKREREVLQGVISGLLNKQIAMKMHIVEKTVKVHRANVMRKMQAESVPHLVRIAATAGLPSAER